MKRWICVIAIALAASLALAGCTSGAASSGGATKGSGEASTTPKPDPTKNVRKSIFVGTRKKTEVFLHITKTYDPKQFSYAAMDGEPSAIPYFQPDPADDEGKVARVYKTYDAKTFKFLVMMSTIIPPQDYYLFEKDGGTLNPAIKGSGYKFAEILDGGHSKILPNFYLGYYDFAYVPLNVLTELWSGNESMNPELWKAGNDYVIVGASYNGGVSLIASPTVTDLNELANSRIGIMNPSYNQEAAIDHKLETIGLSTEAVGGTVGVEMGTPGMVMNDMIGGKLKAVIAWASYEQELRKRLKFQELLKWTDMGYGTKIPYMCLVVRRDILEKHPDIVQKVVQLNYEATKKAQAGDEYKKSIFARTDAFKQDVMGMTVKSNDLNPALTLLDYQANTTFLKDVHTYMKKAGYFKVPYTFDQLVRPEFADKVKR